MPAAPVPSTRLFLCLCGFALLCGLAGCTPGPAGAVKEASWFAGDAASRRARFSSFIDSGNRFYAEKAGYPSFQKSLRYFDSAQALANHTTDTAMLADAVFARGRIYDAWNKEPQKTVRYFAQAAELLKALPGKYAEYLYVRQLVAHAHEKARDTAGAVAVLQQMYAELAPWPAAARDSLNFLPEAALIATEVGAYGLADSILRHLVRRSAIANDPATYNYLDHYYLTQARLDAYWRRRAGSPYLDSLHAVYRAAPSLLDRMFYSERLALLHRAFGSHARAYAYLDAYRLLGDSLENGVDVARMQAALVQSELAAERSRREYEDRLRDARTRAIWALSALLAVITVLAVYLFRRNKTYRAQSVRLKITNAALDEKVSQVELLNKEIQHRVKNNLHMVYSLLHMQERRTDNEEIIEQLQVARLRVESIAALHNRLLAGGRDGVDFGAYMRGLISAVVACLSDDKKVVTHLSSETLSIPPNSYLALSLILNEWVTNSVKYAAAPDGLLEITVSIRAAPAEICIDYRDNGRHVPGVPVVPGLGTQIVELLTRQLSASLSTAPGQPYHFSLCIPHGA